MKMNEKGNRSQESIMFLEEEQRLFFLDKSFHICMQISRHEERESVLVNDKKSANRFRKVKHGANGTKKVSKNEK